MCAWRMRGRVRSTDSRARASHGLHRGLPPTMSAMATRSAPNESCVAEQVARWLTGGRIDAAGCRRNGCCGSPTVNERPTPAARCATGERRSYQSRRACPKPGSWNAPGAAAPAATNGQRRPRHRRERNPGGAAEVLHQEQDYPGHSTTIRICWSPAVKACAATRRRARDGAASARAYGRMPPVELPGRLLSRRAERLSARVA